MDAALTDLLKAWLLPPGGLLVALVLGLLLWQRGIGRLLVLLATVALYLLSIPQTSAWLAGPLEVDAGTDAAGIRAADAQAILVFLAGRSHRAPELGGRDGLSGLSLQRLHHAVRLHRQTGLPLALSGGAAPAEPASEALATLGQRALVETYGLEAALLETASRNTRENASYSAALLKARGIRRVALVTHAWHMPRARYSAEQAGLAVVPAATGFIATGVPGQWAVSDWLPSARALRRNRNLLHEYLGLWSYRHGLRAR